jgi:hypothetical protein
MPSHSLPDSGARPAPIDTSRLDKLASRQKRGTLPAKDGDHGSTPSIAPRPQASTGWYVEELLFREQRLRKNRPRPRSIWPAPET